MIKSQLKFSEVVGETYTTVRNRHGRGDQPRDVGAVGISDAGRNAPDAGKRFVAADALAWHMCRDLTELGMSWSDAARSLRRSRAADITLRDGIQPSTYFAVWEFADHEQGQFASWYGSPTAIAEALEYDAVKYGVVNVRMVSVWKAYETAKTRAAASGYAFEGGEIIRCGERVFPAVLTFVEDGEG